MVTTRRGGDATKATHASPDNVLEFLSQISQALQNRGLSSDWKYDQVESSLQRAVELLPEDSSVRATILEDGGLETYSTALLELLVQEDNGKETTTKTKKKKKKKDSGTTIGRKKKRDLSTSSLVLDSHVLEALDTRDVEMLAKAVVSRFPSVDKGIESLTSCLVKRREKDGVVEYGQICLDIASAVAGLCSRVEDRVASYKVFAEYMKNADDGVDTRLLQSAVGRIHASCCSCARDSQEDGAVWTAWGSTREQENTLISAGQASYGILRLLVQAKLSSSVGTGDVTEQMIKEIAVYAGYMIRLMAPYASIGLMVHHHGGRNVDTGLEDLILFMACSAQDEISHMDREHLKAACYILYMNAGRRAMQIADSHGFCSLNASLDASVSSTMPPLSVTEWLQSQPRSAMMHMLIEQSESGLPCISNALIHSIKDKELHSLASMAYAEIAGKDTVVADEEPSAADELLFFESTEGDLNMLPQQQWIDDDDDEEEEEEEEDDIVIELP
ncbi:hypothetical protein M9435_000912 [Picochlorum sp. BPE23]|nr:hypothetical protein M9435_000912 [Picochlorum sp. BPE23]